MRSKAKKPKSPDPASPARSSRLQHEHAALQSGVSHVAGVDEAGRGPLAGPLVAAAVVFTPDLLRSIPPDLRRLNDSKQLSPELRDTLFAALESHPRVRFAAAIVEPREIDSLNILRATHAAMARALNALDPPPQHALVDGRPVPNLPCSSTPLVRGDAISLLVGAASIIAKVTRDRLMLHLHDTYPLYGFDRHKGYGTRQHLDALASHGPCPAHRRSFAPVQRLLEESPTLFSHN